MAVWVQIQSGASEPIYWQIVEQIRQAIAKGELGVGEKLPAVRKLASELVINPNTVAKAYAVLEQSGLIVTKAGSGTFVADRQKLTADQADMNFLAERMDTVISRGINLGMSGDEIKKMFSDRVKTFEKDNERGRK